MRRKLLVFAVIFIVCAMATPVLAGKGKGGSSRSQYNSSMRSGAGTMSESQIRQQNQYRYQKSQPSDSSVNQTRSQLRTRNPLTHTPVGSMLQPMNNIGQ